VFLWQADKILSLKISRRSIFVHWS